MRDKRKPGTRSTGEMVRYSGKKEKGAKRRGVNKKNGKNLQGLGSGRGGDE